MYAALKAVRVAQGAADNEDESDRDGQLDEYEAQPQPSPQLQRKRKEENPEPSPSPEKVSRKEEPQTPFQSLPPKKLNPDGSFGDPKPKHRSSGRIPQPWLCPVAECGRNNFQWRKECPHCGQEKPPGVVSFIEVTPKRAQPQQMDSQEDDNKEETVAVAVKPVEEENNKKIVSAVDTPAEVVRGSKNNANLEGLGYRRGGRGLKGRIVQFSKQEQVILLDFGTQHQSSRLAISFGPTLLQLLSYLSGSTLETFASKKQE